MQKRVLSYWQCTCPSRGWKYYFDGKEKRLALGGYPDVGLKEARAARDEARKHQQRGAEPVLERQVERLI